MFGRFPPLGQFSVAWGLRVFPGRLTGSLVCSETQLAATPDHLPLEASLCGVLKVRLAHGWTLRRGVARLVSADAPIFPCLFDYPLPLS